MKIDIVDQLDHLDGLIVCLSWIVSNSDFILYTEKPHDYLIQSIRDKIEEISKDVKYEEEIDENTV